MSQHDGNGHRPLFPEQGPTSPAPEQLLRDLDRLVRSEPGLPLPNSQAPDPPAQSAARPQTPAIPDELLRELDQLVRSQAGITPPNPPSPTPPPQSSSQLQPPAPPDELLRDLAQIVRSQPGVAPPGLPVPNLPAQALSRPEDPARPEDLLRNLDELVRSVPTATPPGLHAPDPDLNSVSYPPAEPRFKAQPRIPNAGHLCLLSVIAFFGLLGASLLAHSVLHSHLFGVSNPDDIRLTLGTIAVFYLLSFGGSLVFFPLLWGQGFFAGLQWRGATAFRLRYRLIAAASVCFVLAITSELVLPGPTNAPIDTIIRAPGAAWLLFAFGVTFAPFFEEIAFRGFVLPALCTAWDWSVEMRTGNPARPLDANGHPQWSIFAMVVASVCTSIPFALMHAEQTGHALGPFLLLVCVSLVLCFVRLASRSLAASVAVHACYNFLLFTLMLLGTSGFRHMDKM